MRRKPHSIPNRTNNTIGLRLHNHHTVPSQRDRCSAHSRNLQTLHKLNYTESRKRRSYWDQFGHSHIDRCTQFPHLGRYTSRSDTRSLARKRAHRNHSYSDYFANSHIDRCNQFPRLGRYTSRSDTRSLPGKRLCSRRSVRGRLKYLRRQLCNRFRRTGIHIALLSMVQLWGKVCRNYHSSLDRFGYRYMCRYSLSG
jgi:hypothetical protein